MPQADSFMSMFSTVFGLLISIAALAAFVVVIITCFKVMRYIDQRTITHKLK